ncbi:type II restriction enzyme, methylase subunit; N6 adenine-specific DNA methyltransferase protein [Sphaerospermopsis reniformis]|uniref:site-specific DNA-methyltransferase (adenine-specific) n=1 Tax=Sphaerospermopsis reniformis TaxID=531300 RepID=A0A480A034_9CYAN|nr:DNA methyltransferase [Sphaerospermopsis reniformis]GCL37842.1 type II restriction enzyme, methylase subunit; N6 adenine-specific DNA methyltransferase protein [Sphaerospermopsis reniformis]
MKSEDHQRVEIFLKKWKGSQGNERANYQGFFLELCDALAVERPAPKGSITGDRYCFDKDIKIFNKDGETTNFADFYKEGHFLIEAKQGGNTAKRGTAKRGTKTYDIAMEKAFYQAQSYTPFLPSKPPFLITCDIGSHFEMWMSFSGNYGGYGAREKIDLDQLLDEKVFNRFVAIFNDPQTLNPEKYRARVTREVADTLAKLARWLEKQGHQPQEVANFLMRCIFTMFAEDVKLLKGEVFTKALKERWLVEPKTFKTDIESLWDIMNTGGRFNFDEIPQFNGSFFADATAFDLPKEQLEVLYEAANKDWTEVEPAIFGTLLERALDSKERKSLGAHYTPRSYVERLVRPVVIEPLREEWLLVESEVDRFLTLKEKQQKPTKAQIEKAENEIRGFLDKLQQIRILDPACGSGNFLYVTLDLLKTLEQEVQMRLLDVLGKVTTNLLEEFDPRLAGRKQVNPSQFLGIEINPRAAAIAELVIWIGYLQWHFKRYGSTPPPEPILQDFHNIEFRDAVLDYDGKELDIDIKTGKVKTRWGGKMIKHPVTGEDVPDASDQVPIYRYLNPRSAKWPNADYIVSNPPFIGNARMRDRLGDGYTETLRKVYPDVPDTVDFVMYWWHKAADLVSSKKLKRFGFITTNSISQIRQRSLIDLHFNKNNPVRILFAIPDHPWVDEGASVRIAMTIVELDNPLLKIAQFCELIRELDGETPEDSATDIEFSTKTVGKIFSNLQTGVNISSAIPLRANKGLAFRGMTINGSGFVLTEEKRGKFDSINNNIIKPLWNGKDIAQVRRGVYVIDLHGVDISEAQLKYPQIYQHIYDSVKPERVKCQVPGLREKWWLFERARPDLREAVANIPYFTVTTMTAKHRIFIRIESNCIPDQGLIVFALNDPYYLSILSSQIHVNWTIATGGTLEDRPRYNNSVCFDPFPFPNPTLEQKQKIRELGERLDSHRKRVQTQHPEITITGMYNLLEKLRKGETFTEADKTYNNKALVSTLKQIHDELDNAVFDAYGWQDLKDDSKTKAEIEEIILARLVALNAERAEEERNGIIRWLRPEYQAPNEVTQQVLTEVMETEETVIIPTEQKTFPKQPKDQLAAIRDLLRTNTSEWTVDQIAAQFKNGGKYKNAIAENVERLEWFGILICRETGATKRWQYVEI